MATDHQVAMERLQDLYREKNEHLEKFLESVTPFELYREIFPVGSGKAILRTRKATGLR